MDLPSEYRQRYLQRRLSDFDLCLMALEDKEFDILQRAGHQIKGSADLFGHHDLGLIAIEVEKAAQNRDTSKLEVLLMEFSSWLQKEIN